MKTLPDFLKKHPVKFTWKHGVNPLMGENMSHYTCRITHAGRSGIFAYSKGQGHHGKPPELPEVLSCLAMDAGIEPDFQDFCREFGYDSDSRKAEKIYKACQKNRKKMLRIFGETILDELIYNTERE